MKIWCEKCKGKRKIVISDSLGLGFKERINCDLCDGKGYTENETIEREVRIGKGVIKALEIHTIIPLQYTDDFVTTETIKELLDLAGDDNE